MQQLRICILGGSGFLGRHLCARLALDNHNVTVPTRRVEAAKSISVLPSVRVVAADVHDPSTLERLLSNCDAVINLIGIANEKGRDGRGFRHAHVELVEKVIAACAKTGTERLLQMSSLRADADDGPSYYLKTKGEAEDRIRGAEAFLKWTIFQPSVIFGNGDSFVNRFAGLMRLSPILPLPRPNARFAPVHVDDVAEVCARALGDDSTIGRSFQLCGPKVYSLRELIRFLRDTLAQPGITIGIPDGIAKLQGRIFEWLPGKPFSTDNYRSLTINSICEENGFEHFGLAPGSLENLAPVFLSGIDRNTRLSQFRREAGR